MTGPSRRPGTAGNSAPDKKPVRLRKSWVERGLIKLSVEPQRVERRAAEPTGRRAGERPGAG
jgi:hypothetical protein